MIYLDLFSIIRSFNSIFFLHGSYKKKREKCATQIMDPGEEDTVDPMEALVVDIHMVMDIPMEVIPMAIVDGKKINIMFF